MQEKIKTNPSPSHRQAAKNDYEAVSSYHGFVGALQEAVGVFNDNVCKFPPYHLDNEIDNSCIDQASAIYSLQNSLKSSARLLRRNQAHNPDQRWCRLGLIIEEVDELMEALIVNDEAEVLDALADIMYLCIGTALQFDLPIMVALLDVCRSNLTKGKQTTDSRPEKGESYSPPNIKEIIETYREQYNADN